MGRQESVGRNQWLSLLEHGRAKHAATTNSLLMLSRAVLFIRGRTDSVFAAPALLTGTYVRRVAFDSARASSCRMAVRSPAGS